MEPETVSDAMETTGSSDMESLKQQIDAQGTKVRELKSSGADKVRERERERGRFIND